MWISSSFVRFKTPVICVNLSCHRQVYENCALLGFYAASSSNSLPTFRDNPSVPSPRAKNLLDPTWPIGRLEITTTHCATAQNSTVSPCYLYKCILLNYVKHLFETLDTFFIKHDIKHIIQYLLVLACKYLICLNPIQSSLFLKYV